MTETTLTSIELDALIALMENHWSSEISEITGLDVGQCRTLLNKLIDMQVEEGDDRTQLQNSTNFTVH